MKKNQDSSSKQSSEKIEGLGDKEEQHDQESLASLAASFRHIQHGNTSPAQWLAIQRTLGNRVTTSLIEQRESRKRWPASDTIQRQDKDDSGTVDQSAAVLKAVNIANSRSLLKVSVPVKAPPRIKVFGGLELKEIAVGMEISGSASAVGLGSAKSTTSVGAASAKTNAQASVYSLDLEQKFGSTPFAEMFSFTAKGQSTYDPAQAMKPGQKQFAASLGLKVAAEGVSASVDFAPISYDRSKKGMEAFELATTTAEVKGTFTKKLPGFANLGGTKINATVNVSVTGSVKVGPDSAKAYKAMMRYLGKEGQKEALEKAAKAIAEEEMELTLRKLVKDIVADEVKDIVDKDARRVAQEYAERKLTQEVQKRQLKLQAAEQASIFVRRELTEKAAEQLSIMAIRAETKSIVAGIAKPLTSQLRVAVRVMVKEGIRQFSAKALGRNIAKSLVAGPADFVLIGV